MDKRMRHTAYPALRPLCHSANAEPSGAEGFSAHAASISVACSCARGAASRPTSSGTARVRLNSLAENADCASCARAPADAATSGMDKSCQARHMSQWQAICATRGFTTVTAAGHDCRYRRVASLRTDRLTLRRPHSLLECGSNCLHALHLYRLHEHEPNKWRHATTEPQ